MQNPTQPLQMLMAFYRIGTVALSTQRDALKQFLWKCFGPFQHPTRRAVAEAGHVNTGARCNNINRKSR